MAISQNGSSASDYVDVEVSPILEIPFTVSAGSNRLMTVAYSARTVGKPIATMTFDGQSLVQAIGISGNTMDAEVWYLVAPNVTTEDVIVTLAGGGVFAFSGATVTCWDGVAQSSPVEDTDSISSVLATSLSFSALTTTTDGCLVIDAYSGNSQFPIMTAETNRLLIHDNPVSGQVGNSRILTKSPAGSVTMEWTAVAPSQCSLAGAAFKPFVEPASDFSGGNDNNILIGQPKFGSGGPSIGMGFNHHGALSYGNRSASLGRYRFGRGIYRP